MRSILLEGRAWVYFRVVAAKILVPPFQHQARRTPSGEVADGS
ncbi:hypothetical protein [Pararhizobium sp. LjRoot238]